MKKMMMLMAAAAMLVCTAPTVKADTDWDKGPDRVTVTNAPAYAVVTLATVGEFERFAPDLIMTDAPASQTQTVYWVVGTLTNTVASFIPSATLHTLSVTNLTMFHGDRLICVPSGDTATTNKYWTSGRRYN